MDFLLTFLLACGRGEIQEPLPEYIKTNVELDNLNVYSKRRHISAKPPMALSETFAELDCSKPVLVYGQRYLENEDMIGHRLREINKFSSSAQSYSGKFVVREYVLPRRTSYHALVAFSDFKRRKVSLNFRPGSSLITIDLTQDYATIDVFTPAHEAERDQYYLRVIASIFDYVTAFNNEAKFHFTDWKICPEICILAEKYRINIASLTFTR